MREVFEHYRLPVVLQQHLLRVAGVAAVYLDGTTFAMDREAVITACLLHDAANIIKFDLTKFPEFLEPEGTGYWQKVQAEFIAKYGAEEKTAHVAIAKELGVSEKVQQLMAAVGFSEIAQTLAAHNPEEMLCEYADIRVTPWGVVSLDERLEDLRVRYQHNYPGEENERRRQGFVAAAHQLETDLFAKSNLQPSDITETRVQAYQAELLAWPIP